MAAVVEELVERLPLAQRGCRSPAASGRSRAGLPRARASSTTGWRSGGSRRGVCGVGHGCTCFPSSRGVSCATGLLAPGSSLSPTFPGRRRPSGISGVTPPSQWRAPRRIHTGFPSLRGRPYQTPPTAAAATSSVRRCRHALARTPPHRRRHALGRRQDHRGHGAARRAARRRTPCRRRPRSGPDFIDPGYHALACGRPPRNLDPWICGADATVGPGRAGRRGCRRARVEGVMGLFDGAADGHGVVDGRRRPAARCAGACWWSTRPRWRGRWRRWCTGSPRWIRASRIAGVVLNRVGSEGHAIQLREALEPLGIAVVGVLRRDDRLVWRDRHLGLVPVLEDPTAVRRDARPSGRGDRRGLRPRRASWRWPARRRPFAADDVPSRRTGPPVRVGVAAGPAFTFLYTDTARCADGRRAPRSCRSTRSSTTALPEHLDGLHRRRRLSRGPRRRARRQPPVAR